MIDGEGIFRYLDRTNHGMLDPGGYSAFIEGGGTIQEEQYKHRQDVIGGMVVLAFYSSFHRGASNALPSWISPESFGQWANA